MRTRILLITMAILVLGLIGTGLSTLYRRDEGTFLPIPGKVGTTKVSYGLPLSWYGYSIKDEGPPTFTPPPKVYWFNLEPFFLDIAFWFAFSSIVCLAIFIPVNMLSKTRASKNLSVINI
jgi:hypothetical protein